jgi:hypothetical protein
VEPLEATWVHRSGACKLLDLQAVRMVSSECHVTGRQGYQGLRDTRQDFDQTSNICSSINTLPALLLLHAPFCKRFFLRYRGYVADGLPTCRTSN